MSQDRHAEKYEYDKFCARSPSGAACGCGNDYFKVCKPGWSNWTYAVKGNSASGAVRKKYEAHHILCWSCVTGIILKRGSKTIVKGTKWCINNKRNMIALPMWGHTVKWYVHHAVPAPFMNLPQHDLDHNSEGGYTDEVKAFLKTLVKDIKRAKQAHQLPPPEDIAGALDSKSSSFRATLRQRGLRGGGTDAAWERGIANPDSAWYLAFSMARAGVARSFPRNFKDKRREKLEQIREAQKLLSGGS